MPKGLIQPKDYGDIIALQGIANFHGVTAWPVCPHVIEVFRHFPDIEPILLDGCTDLAQHYYHQAYDVLVRRGFDVVDTMWHGRANGWERQRTVEGLKRWPQQVRETLFVDELKYLMAEVPIEEKHRGFRWKRFPDKENTLLDHARQIAGGSRYVVVHQYDNDYKSVMAEPIRLVTDLPVVKVEAIPGFTVLDWYAVFCEATEIHMIDSAPANFVECAGIGEVKHLHLYARKNTRLQPKQKWGFAFRDDWTKHYA